jgi:hypothetical protein
VSEKRRAGSFLTGEFLLSQFVPGHSLFGMLPVVAAKKRSKFDPKTFLSTIDGGRKIAAFPKKQTIFVPGDSSNAVFYIVIRQN